MTTKKVNRNGHATGKNYQEKVAYRQFLSSKFDLEKTAPDPVDIGKTNESSYDEEEIPKIKERQKKSLKLVVKDFLHDNWVITIMGGLISGLLVAFLIASINIYTDQKIINDKIKNIETTNKDNSEKLSSVKEKFEIFKAEIGKDLEYIKKKIKL
jgi:hypothetical protein